MRGTSTSRAVKYSPADQVAAADECMYWSATAREAFGGKEVNLLRVDGIWCKDMIELLLALSVRQRVLPSIGDHPLSTRFYQPLVRSARRVAACEEKTTVAQ